jgi:hypothetical protein
MPGAQNNIEVFRGDTPLGERLAEARSGRSLYSLFVWLAILAFLVESFLANRIAPRARSEVAP